MMTNENYGLKSVKGGHHRVLALLAIRPQLQGMDIPLADIDADGKLGFHSDHVNPQ